ncbi:TetR family transcriptional regulator [Paenibacillus sp. 453mf]|uniref:TetR family transcriptional regulator n=1 Tax=Paenibacillus sp. 453mf TaxID=1761874 RepID=UPI0008F18948|nr:TetR family transcriptional regulator [Paenibacillus sp. 453mf]SFS55148.1 DNA-binding transcriptional regulator, AcrR family [Paenibacillus sp. 453mf]
MSPKLTDRRKEQRRLQILDAAKCVFAKKGYGAVSLKDIIEETGMSRGWIYLYYQTKDEIFEALLDHQDKEHEGFVEELIEASSSIWEVVNTLYAQQLEELQLLDNGSLLPAFYEYFLVGWRDPSRRKMLEIRYENGIQRFAELLQLGIQRGEFSPVMDIMEISRLASSFQEGIMTHSITIGTTKANTSKQFNALLRYLNNLLQPTSVKDPKREGSEEEIY